MNEHNHPAADRLEAFVEGTLQDGDRAVLESHLLTCPACQTQVEEWRGLFSALSSLPQFDPSVGFANRVMEHVRIAPRAAWQEWTDRAGALAARIAPKTNYGWSLAVAFLALPILLGGSAIAWLVSKSYITTDALMGYTRDSIIEGLQGVGSTVITFVMQTELTAWVVANIGAVISTAGVTGLGAMLAGAGSLTVLSTWVLYRNLFRSPSRESDYALYSL
ncbi:MAG: zf-HC2 domain-containing protein [Gemmatimonadetes bacterium]|nr:zf-HC2 domain-containing protein [Gemmatimonadota bacterium]